MWRKRRASSNRSSERALEVRDRGLILETCVGREQAHLAGRLQGLQKRGQSGLSGAIRVFGHRLDRRRLRNDLISIAEEPLARRPSARRGRCRLSRQLGDPRVSLRAQLNNLRGFNANVSGVPRKDWQRYRDAGLPSVVELRWRIEQYA